MWSSRCEVVGFTNFKLLSFHLALFMLSRGPLPFTRCRLCLASLLAGVSSGIDWHGGGSSEYSDNRNLCSPCGLVECVAWGLLLRVKPLGRVFRGICKRRLGLCIYHVFGDGHRFENKVHLGGSRCSGRNRREGRRHDWLCRARHSFA